MTAAFYGGVKFEVEIASTMTNVEEVMEVSGFGETLELLDATNFDSAGSKEYIAGLADGKEFTVSANYLTGAKGTAQEFLRSNKGSTIPCQISFDDGVDAAETYYCDAVLLGWEITPSINDKHALAFTMKITGGITKV